MLFLKTQDKSFYILGTHYFKVLGGALGARHKHALNFASPVDNIVIIKKSTVFTTARQWRAFKCLLLRRFFNFLCTEKNCSSHHFNTFNKMTYTVYS